MTAGLLADAGNVASKDDSLPGVAYRITFAPELPSGAEPLVVVKQPIQRTAIAEHLDLSEVLSRVAEKPGEPQDTTLKVASDAAVDSPLLLLCLPTAGGMIGDFERLIESWLAEDSGVVPLRAGLRTSRVAWTNSRAVIYAGPQQMNEAANAVTRFVVAARQVAQLEQTMATAWSAIDAQAPTLHAISPRQQRQQVAVDALTEVAASMMSSFLRLESALEQLDPALSTASKRLFAEMVQQATLYERLEILEGPVEHAWDLCELANTRLIEANYAGKSQKLELWIVVLLVAETLVLLLQTLVLLFPVLLHFFHQ